MFHFRDKIDHLNLMLAEKIGEVYNRGVYNDIAPPHQVVKYLSDSRTLFLCDAELSNEDIVNIISFLCDKVALNHIEHVSIRRTSSTQVNYRRIANSREVSTSSLNGDDFKLFKELINFIHNSKSLKSLSFQNIEIREEIVFLLSAALENSLSPIQWLSFVSCNFGRDYGLKLLTPSIGRMRSLSVLSIEQCGLTDVSIPYISSIIKAHSSQMDSLFWNSQLRVNYVGNAVQDVDNSVLGLGLVAVSLFGNLIEGENIDYLIKVLRDNYWLLGLNIADNKLSHTAVAVMMNDLLSSSNKMRAVLLKDNPGLQPYTAKSLSSFMESSAVAASQQLQSQVTAKNDSYISVDGRLRLTLLPTAEAQLLRHWMSLQLIEASDGVGRRPLVSQIKDQQSARHSNTLTLSKSTTAAARRYVSPALARYSREKRNRLEQKSSNDSYVIQRPYSHFDLYGTVEFAREILDKKLAKELDAQEAVPRSSTMKRRGSGDSRKYGTCVENNEASELHRTNETIDTLDLLSMGVPTRKTAANTDAINQKYRYEDNTRLSSRRSSDASQLSDLSRRIGREQKPRAHRSPVPGARTTRRAHTSPTRRTLSVSTGRDRLADRPRYEFYNRVLHHRALAVDRELSTMRQRSASLKVRHVQTASFDAEELRERSIYQSTSKPKTRKRNGDRSRTDSEQSDMTSMDRENRGGIDEASGEKRASSHLDQCIASMLQASSHLENVSQKLQGVVETISESMNISVSMQRQQLLHSTQDSILYNRDEKDVLVLEDRHRLRDGEHQKFSNVNVFDGSYRNEPQNGVLVSESQSDIFEESGRARLGSLSESEPLGNLTAEPKAEEGELSTMIKERMRSKLRMLLKPEFEKY